MVVLNAYRVATNVNGLGFGRRLSVWLQGCDLKHKCAGCCSPETWKLGLGRDITPEAVLAWAAQTSAPEGLTLSGGEPTLQSAAAGILVEQFREAYPEADVLLYSGLSFAALRKRAPALVERCDVVVAGPYRHDLPPAPLRGSSNQKVVLLTDRGRDRYHDVDSWPMRSQLLLQNGQAVTVGIPNMAAIAAAAHLCAQE